MPIPALRHILVLGGTVPALAVVPEALAIPYAAGWHADPLAAGLLLSAVPVGTLLGEITAGNLVPARWQVRLIYPVAAALFVPLLVFAVRPVVWLAVVVLLLSGCFAWSDLGQDRRLVDTAPEQLRGRALSIHTAGLLFWQGIGFAAGGAAAELLAPHLVITVAAAIGIVFVLLMALSDRRRPPGRVAEPVDSGDAPGALKVEAGGLNP